MSRATMAMLVALALVAAAGYWWMNRPPGPYTTDNSGLYPITVDGKVGFMDRTGKTVVAPQFDETYGFSEGMAAVRIGTKFGYIDTKGLVTISPQFDDARAFRYGRATVKLCCGRGSAGVPGFQSNPNDRYGVIDDDGKYVVGPTLRWVDWWYSGNVLAVQNDEGEVSFIDQAGKTSIEGDFDQLRAFNVFTEGLLPAGKAGKWGFIDSTGKWAIEPQFEEADSFGDGLAGVRVAGRTGYIDRDGRFVVNPQYEAGQSFREGYAKVLSAGKWGFIDGKGGVAVNPLFQQAWDFSAGLAAVLTDTGFGYIDPTGKMVISAEFDSAAPFQNGLARVTALGKEAYITTTGSFVIEPFEGRTLAQERVRREAEAKQAELDAAAAQQAAAVRAVEERAQMILKAPANIVGVWQWQGEVTTYQADGIVKVVSANGGTATNRWALDGEVSILKQVEVNGRPVIGPQETRFRIDWVDQSEFRVTNLANGQSHAASRLR